jgi:GT2 family glycosyltransferase
MKMDDHRPTTHDVVAEALAQAAALRQEFRSALEEARASLLRAEQTNQQLHRELDLMTGSPARRLAVTTRQGAMRVLRAIRHPLWTTGTLARGLTAAPVPATVTRAVTHVLRRSFPLRLSGPTRRWSSGADQSVAVRWVGPVNLRHRTREALLCHPPAGIEFRVSVPSHSRFLCEVALSPQVWAEHPPPVEFSAVLEIPSTGWRREAKLTIDPGARWTDRRWHPLSISLPQTTDPSIDITVTLSTGLPSGADVSHAWALFGEPRFEWRRETAEVRRSAATFASRIRTDGLRRSLELLRVTGITSHDAYPRWVARHTRGEAELAALAAQVAALPRQPLISIITPVYNTDPRWLRACIESVRRQVYPNWQLCLCDDASSAPETIEVLREYEADARIRVRYSSVNGGISAASNAALEDATGEFVGLLDHDDELPPDALAEVALYLEARPETDVLYSDEDKLDTAGARCDAYFKPDWSPEYFLTCMYTCHFMVIRRVLLAAVGGFRVGYEGAQDYDLLLRLMERTSSVHHIPRVLYHWRKLPESTASASQAKPWALDAGRRALEDYVRRNKMEAEVLPGGLPGVYRVKRRVRGRPVVSIVIPTAGRLRTVRGQQVDMLARAIRSLVERTDYDAYELIVVADADGVLPETSRALHGTKHQVLRFERLGLFNFSAKVNAGAAVASGDHLLLFNDDLEVTSGDWLTAMLEYSQEPAIGAVGSKLLYPDGRLQHVGIVLGVAGVAAHPFHQHPGVSPGYAGSALMVRNYSAVTGACLMSRRSVFEEAGGFDERFPIDFNDVDYCLRLQRAGYRVVFTPWAQLYHHESASFGTRRQDLTVVEEMRRRWGPLIHRDPYYNPNLTRDFPDYRLDA